MMADRVRINADIDPAVHAWLTEQRRRDRIRTTERLRALLALCMEDPELNRRVLAKAAELDEQQHRRET